MFNSLKDFLTPDKYNVFKYGMHKHGAVMTHYIDVKSMFSYYKMEKEMVYDCIQCMNRPDDGSEDISTSRRIMLKCAFIQWYNANVRKLMRFKVLSNCKIRVYCSGKFEYPIWQNSSNYIKPEDNRFFDIQSILSFRYVPMAYAYKGKISCEDCIFDYLDFYDLFTSIKAISFENKKNKFIIMLGMDHTYTKDNSNSSPIHKTPVFFSDDKLTVFNRTKIANNENQVYLTVKYTGSDIEFLNEISSIEESPISNLVCEIETNLFGRHKNVTIF